MNKKLTKGERTEIYLDYINGNRGFAKRWTGKYNISKTHLYKQLDMEIASQSTYREIWGMITPNKTTVKDIIKLLKNKMIE